MLTPVVDLRVSALSVGFCTEFFGQCDVCDVNGKQVSIGLSRQKLTNTLVEVQGRIVVATSVLGPALS